MSQATSDRVDLSYFACKGLSKNCLHFRNLGQRGTLIHWDDDDLENGSDPGHSDTCAGSLELDSSCSDLY